VLQEGSTLLLFEIKASILTVQAKYGFSPGALRSELEQKVIKGERSERKGVAQIHHNITRWLNGEDLPGIERSSVKTIQPVLVFLDHAFASPYLNIVYNQYFNSADLRRAYRGTTITPLFSITIEDLENTLPYTNHDKLRDILESYYRANKGMPGMLSHSRVPLLQEAKPGKDVVRERFHDFANRLEQRFFPQS
jgi:hypothetical protein